MRRFFLSCIAFIVSLASTAQGQSKALVYCPSADQAGCGNIVTALTGMFTAVDRGYDGSGGTLNLATVDLNHYSVVVVPSLGDQAEIQPYALLRDPRVASRLKNLLVGRTAIWSGTPDQGTANRDAKNTLLRNLARWAAAAHATAGTPGVVVLQDISVNAEQRYGWLTGISRVTVRPDANPGAYDAVQPFAAGVEILNAGTEPASVLAYANMASYGLHLPTDAAGMLAGALGGGPEGQIVLVTFEPAPTGTATIDTDLDTYAPGATVRVTGEGWQAGETVTIVLHEDPFRHENRVITTTATSEGRFTAQAVIEMQNTAADFTLTASGAVSLRTARAVFARAAQSDAVEVFLQAHQEDWQVFIGDRVVAAAGTAGKVVFIYTTAGDAQESDALEARITAAFRTDRESGAQASVDAITPAGAWACAVATVNSHAITRCTKANTVSYYLRLPNGNEEGQDYLGRGTLSQLRAGVRSALTSMHVKNVVAPDETWPTTSYTSWQDVVSTVQAIIAAEAAGRAERDVIVYAPEWEVRLMAGDHSDRIATGELARAASWGHAWNHAWYLAYRNLIESPNLTAEQYAAKWATVEAYEAVVGPNWGTIINSNTRAWASRTIARAEPSNGSPRPTPTAVRDLRVTARNGGIDVTWQYDAGDAEAFRVERAPDFNGSPGGYTVHTQLPPWTTSWSNTEVVAGVSYWYRVRALTAFGSSAYSAELLVQARAECVGPTFTSQPSNATRTVGQSVTFTAAATGTNPTYQWRRDGVVIPDATGSSYTISSVTLADAGSYDVVVTDACGAATSSAAQLTIGKATASVTLSELAHTFDGTPKLAVVTTTPAALSVTVSYSLNGSVVAAPVAAGTYLVVATVSDDAYAGTATGDLVIDKATPVIVWAVPPRDVEFGTPLEASQLSAMAYDVDGEALDGTFTFTPDVGATLDVGTHSVTATFTPADAANYTIAQEEVSFNVLRATPVFDGLTSHTVAYGVDGVTLSGRLTGVQAPTGMVVITLGSGALAQEHAAVIQSDGSFSASLSTREFAASAVPYPIVYRYDGDANFVATIDNSTSLTITAATASLTLSGLTHAYDGTAKSAQVTATPAGVGDIAVAYRQNGAVVTPIRAGTYSVEATITNPNYRLADGSDRVTGTLEIAKAPLTVTADDAGRSYGQANPAFTGTIAGLVAGDVISARYTSAATAASAVGTYPIDAALEGDAGALANYDVTERAGSLTITPAALTVTAVDREHRYDGAPASGFTARFDGFALGENPSVLGGTLTFGGPAASATDVGTYSLVPAGATSTNYTIAFVAGELRITPAPLTIEVDDATRGYGDPNPGFTGTLTGLVAGDGITAGYTTAAAPESAVGTYPIEVRLTDPRDKLTNYAPTISNGTLTVVQVPLTVLPASATRLYGDANPALGGTIEGLKNGDAITASFSTTATAGSAVGSYEITGTLLDATPSRLGNYTVTHRTGTLEVGAARLTIAANPKTRIYGGANPPLDGAIQGVRNNDAVSATFTTTATVTSPVGTHVIEAAASAATGVLANYDVVTTAGELTITPAPLTVIANDHVKAYDGAPFTGFTAEYDGFVLNETAAVLSGTLLFGGPANGATEVGEYAIVPTGVTSQNYTITFRAGTLTVAKRVLTVTVANAERMYGDPNPEFTGTLAGLTPGDRISATYSTSASAASGVGTYEIVSSLTDPDGALANYTLVTNRGMLTVTQAELTVTAANRTKRYGETVADLSGAITGVRNADVLTVEFASVGGATASPVGTYPITATVGGSAATLRNYAITSTPGVLTVSPAPLTVTVTDASRAYGAPNPAFSVRYSGFVAGEGPAALAGTLSFATGAAQASNVGSYAVTPSGLSATNYGITFAPGTLVVERAPLTITADDQSKSYDGAEFTGFTARYAGFVLGQTASVLDGALVFSGSAVGATGIGTYVITPSGVTADNYDVTFADGRLVIGKSTLTVTAASATREYGSDNPSLTGSVIGLAAGDRITATYSSPATIATGVGSYPILPTLVDPDGKATNYEIDLVSGVLTVTPAALTVTPEGAERAYGDANPALTGAINGVRNGDAIGAQYTTDATAASPVGSYAIAASLEASSATLANYEVVREAGILEVVPAPLTVAASNATREYGLENPAFAGVITGARNGDAILASYATVAGIGSAVGTYPIVPTAAATGGASLANYAVTVANGALTVTQAALTVTPANQTKTYGQTFTNYTGSIGGVRNDDAITATYASTGASASSATGSYPITATLNGMPAVLANYAVTRNTGALQVMPAPLTITADDASRAVGAANPAFTARFSGFVAGETESVLGGTLVFTTAATVSSPAGEYAVTPGGVTSSNYTISFIAGTLRVIAKATPSIVWTPTDVVIPAALGASQLNAVARGTGDATLTGTYAYSSNGTTVTTGTILPPGVNTPLTVVFTPTGADANSYGPAAMTVTTFNVLNKIDITPGSTSNAISLGGTQKEIIVGVVSTANFDARSMLVSGSTPTLGNGSGVETALARNNSGGPKTGLTDLNYDGRLDVLFYFPKATLISNGDVTSTTTQLILQGQLANGVKLKGVDKVSVIP